MSKNSPNLPFKEKNGHFPKNCHWHFFLKKMIIFGNILEKKGAFLAIFWHSDGNVSGGSGLQPRMSCYITIKQGCQICDPSGTNWSLMGEINNFDSSEFTDSKCTLLSIHRQIEPKLILKFQIIYLISCKSGKTLVKSGNAGRDSQVRITRDVRFGSKVDQICPKFDKSGSF